MTYTIEDTGGRRHFATGSVRDRGDLKPRPDYISPWALERVGEHLRKGACKYGARNWQLGQPFSEMTASLYRHLLEWLKGSDKEDHLAAIVFNAQALIHFQEMIRIGVLPSELDDMPRYAANQDSRDHGKAVPAERQPTEGQERCGPVR